MRFDVLVAGETLIDFLPARPGPLSDVDGFDRRPGGAPANVAVALARLEQPPLFWTRVGSDPFGRYLEETLIEEGIPDRRIERDPDAKTTLAFVTHDEPENPTFTFYRDGTADTRLESGTVGNATLADCEWIHAGGVALSSGSSRAATLDLLERGADRGCTVSFDPNARPELWSDGDAFTRVVREALAHVDVLKATVEELETLGFAGETAEELADDALDGGPHTVLVTRGSAGAIGVATEEAPWPGVVEHGGYDVDVVDTTGAGDAFVAGSIAALRAGEGLEAALEFANGVAASATTAAGAMAALPSRETVRSLRESADDS